ncbi:MAG: hypothetical protein A3E82_04450 [Gammaproteobacteria bacterium RIFCSPHIGHO2_12_FULL_38_11]|nr:MAG: hypothetical protein A3E82_04450 [Gammaproteobacteria bacterium RIFCSPHIGHO2_12_FULL_38_11]
MQRLLIILGIICILIGIAWPLIKKLNIGNLPGDIIIKKQSFSFYFPITTCIIISIVISVLFWIFKR